MTKVIVLSTVLGLSALGMACGETATNVSVNANKPAANVAPVSTPATVTTPAANVPATNTMAANNSAMKPAANAAPSPMATKKP